MSFRLIEKVLGSTNPEPLSATSLTVCQAFVQVKRANSNKMEIGPGTFVTGEAIELLAPEADTTLPSFNIVPTGSQNNLDLMNWSILGTSGEGVNIVIEEF